MEASGGDDFDLARLQGALGGRYEIRDRIGSGGMGTVYLAWDRRHGRRVAVKLIRADLPIADARAGFLREVGLMAALAHPHIVPIHDSGEQDGRLFYVMPYYEGTSLATILQRQGPLPPPAALGILRELADALDHAHEHGIVHCDIKPSNVLMEAGQALLADFGIAFSLFDGLGKPLAGVGSSPYMSPQQIEIGCTKDGACDRYALAVLLYEVLTGQLPFRGRDAAAVLQRKLTAAIPTSDGLSPALRAFFETALAPSPDDRFPTGRAVYQAFAEASVGAPRARHGVLWVVGFMVGGAAVLATAYVLLPGAAAHRPVDDAVAVRFISRAQRPELEGLAAVAVDLTTDALQRSGVTRVVPSESALGAARYVAGLEEAGQSVDATGTFAEETGASLVAEGRYFTRGDRIIAQLDLVKVDPRTVVRSTGPVEGALDDPISALSEAAQRFVGLLALSTDQTLAPEQMPSSRPPRYQAYLRFADGMRAYLDTDFETAATRFREAFEMDDAFVMPLLYAAISLSNRGRNAEADSLLRVVDIRRDELTEYDRGLLDYRLAFERGDATRALQAIRDVARRAPGTKAVYNYGIQALESGLFEEAATALRGLDPDRGAMRGWIGYWDELTKADHLLQDHDRELADADRTMERFPNRLRAYLIRARALAARGDLPALESLTATAFTLPRDDRETAASLAWVIGLECELHGHGGCARAYLARARTAFESVDSLTSYERLAFGQVLFLADDRAALRQFARAMTERRPADVATVGFLGIVAARAGDRAQTAASLESLRSLDSPSDFGESLVWQARIHAVSQDPQGAIQALQRAFAKGRDRAMRLHEDAFLSGLRGNPGFDRLLAPR